VTEFAGKEPDGRARHLRYDRCQSLALGAAARGTCFFTEKPKRAGDSIVSIVIREPKSGTVLAEGAEGAEIVSYEGNLYFEPTAVNQQALQVTERTYTCPYKGTCNWVDFVGTDGIAVRDVAWIYPKVNPGHEPIEGRFGFYATSRGATRREDA
jgi:uncharacterized protein (DUF427 family)